MPKVLVLIPCFNVANYIEDVFNDLPWQEISKREEDFTFLVINDGSIDDTLIASERIQDKFQKQNICVLSNKTNIGYGGVQKIGLTFASNYNFDFIVLLHGDGQYTPKLILNLLVPAIDKNYDLILGSRMKNKISALKGGMPIYKWIGNIVLTKIQNLLLGSSLTEFHTGYRVYSKKLYSTLLYENNSNYYDFDTQIIIQALEAGLQIHEVGIPTIYRGEISNLNGILYSLKVLRSTIRHSTLANGWRKFWKNEGNQQMINSEKINILLEGSYTNINVKTREVLTKLKKS